MSVEGMIRCPHCGKMHPKETIYCPENGMPIWQAENEPAQAPPPPRRTNTVWIIAGAAVGAAVLCLIVAIVLLALRKPAADVLPTETQPPVILATVFQSTATPEPSLTSQPQVATVTPSQTVTPNRGPWEACPGADYLSRLRVGDKARVSSDPPLANRVRTEPKLTSAIVGYIQPGEEVEILEGPGCSSNWVWWRVHSTETDMEGWTAEGDNEGYWLVPEVP